MRNKNDGPVKIRFCSLTEHFREILRASPNFKNSAQAPQKFEIFNAQQIASLCPKLLNVTRKKTFYGFINFKQEEI
jgi:hypothetical protein